MFFIIVAIIAVVVIGCAVLGLFLAETSDGKAGAVATIVGAVIVVLLVYVFTSITVVGSRSVGIATNFGKYSTTYSSGWHWTAPWTKVSQFSTQTQPLHLTGDEGISVTFKGGGRGDVGATPRWRINESDPKAAYELWAKYRSFDHVRDYLVIPSVRQSFRVVLGNYTPNDARLGENLEDITNAVQADLDKTLQSDGIIIDSVSLQYINLDANTQKSLDAIVTANNNIERAIAEQKRARIDAKTAEIRSKTGANDKGNLVRYCLDVTNAWDSAKNGPLPATWNCFAGSNASVLVGNK